VNFIRGWTNSESGTQPNPPLLRDVQLFPKDCPLGLGLADPYFALLSGKCNVTLAAMVDAALSGGGAPGSLNITVVGAGCPNKGCALAPDNAVPASQECAAVMAGGASGQCWKGQIPVNAFAGAQPLTMSWQVTQGTINGKDCTKGQGCSGVFEGGGV